VLSSAGDDGNRAGFDTTPQRPVDGLGLPEGFTADGVSKVIPRLEIPAAPVVIVASGIIHTSKVVALVTWMVNWIAALAAPDRTRKITKTKAIFFIGCMFDFSIRAAAPG
jgi:hypothetical protein